MNTDVPHGFHPTIGLYAAPVSFVGPGGGGIGLDVTIAHDRWPVSLAASTMLAIPGAAPMAVAYARVAVIRTPGFAAGVAGGGGVTWTSQGCPGSCPPGHFSTVVGPAGPLLGAFAEWDWGDRWLRLQPSAFFPSRYTWTPDGAMPLMMGPAWIEYGWRLGDHLELSLRSTVSPIRLAWRF